MIAITTNNSINVKAPKRFRARLFSLLSTPASCFSADNRQQREFLPEVNAYNTGIKQLHKSKVRARIGPVV
jgi:hypothetical protein